MNPQETEQVIARDELWVPTAERVNISTKMFSSAETTVIAAINEETRSQVLYCFVSSNSTCIKAFTIFVDVPEILMQQFWYTITKIKGSESYEFLLADKRCVIDAEVFRKILDICLRKEGEDFIEVQNDEDTLTFPSLILGYSDTDSLTFVKRNPQQALKNKGIFDSGCSRHMIGNKDLLTDYQDIDGDFVAFGGGTRRVKITGKGKIRTDKLDFEDVFFVKELNFNLYFVSQMCDKKNNVLFTETECLVLSPDFKLLDENRVLLRVPTQSNMYSFDLRNVVPSGDLTCLFANATIDESKLWHRRMGHVNFKTMNKLVKGNLVRGLPSKIFVNDHTCVACQKGKQHKASCKTKLVSSISQPLQMLHMDLFGPTSVRSINHKTYCLVVTDDFSRFSWVFFLASKDETSGILKRFIIEIENQLNHKVKVIRCDNGTEFKNREMNELCGLKGIKREFSVARTPQQNGVAERKNRTLIEAVRIMLADSLLPTVFWAEAVNTTYPLGKFDGKAEEGFLVGYSVNSKAFRVFNTETRKVKKNLHVNFLEYKLNVAGQGPNWLFDIDSLTNSMNYQPITAENQTNKNAGPLMKTRNTGLKKNVDVGQTKEENVSTQQYIVFPLWSSISSNYKSSDDKAEDDTVDDDALKSSVQEPTT
ncbi:putative ribonuclease H-like domain-containing protein [Tanacetum coccineum]